MLRGNTMNRTRLVFVAILVIAAIIVGVGLLWQAPDQQNQDGETPPPLEKTAEALPSDTVVVEIHSSNTKEDWLDQVVAAFNEGNHKVGDMPIFVTVYHVGSGSSMNDILDGEIQPVVWSPGSDLWVTAINQHWRDRTGRALTDESCPATLRLPLVIAMWQPMAEALGWPDAPIGWDDLADLSTNPHPEHSNSGMLSLVAEVYSAAERTEGLTVDAVKSQQVMDSVGAVEQRVFHYGKKDTDILERMTQRG